MNGSLYDEDGEIDKDILRKRQDREDFWIKNLRTFYPYGLNACKDTKKLWSKEGYVTTGHFYFPVKRYGQRNGRCKNRRNYRQSRIYRAF